MSDLPNDITPEEPRTSRPAPRKRSQKRKAPVFTYLIILFLAAFLLLAMSYFMQQRKLEGMDASLAGLKESVSAMQTVEAMQEDNANLRTQVADLEKQLEEITAERDSLSLSLERSQSAADDLNKQTIALEWLRQIQNNYDRKFYRYARPMIQQFNAYGLEPYLPTVSTVNSDELETEAPADAYQRIVEALFPDGIPPLDEESMTFSTTLPAASDGQ